MIERINNIFLDYENGTIQINGQVPSRSSECHNQRARWLEYP